VRALLPSTYAAEALKPGFAGGIAGSQVWDLLILAGFGAVSFWAVSGPLWPKAE
jgi:hypothetical protein